MQGVKTCFGFNSDVSSLFGIISWSALSDVAFIAFSFLSVESLFLMVKFMLKWSHSVCCRHNFGHEQ